MFPEQQLVVLCMDLFIAGSETTSTTLAFLFLYLVLYPDVQQRARDELITVIGVERLPCLDDAPK
jgi:cytochrome P450